MERRSSRLFNLLTIVLLAAFLASCNERAKPPATDIVEKKEAWEERTAKNLREHLSFAMDNKGKLNDSLSVNHINIINTFYKAQSYQLAWSTRATPKYAANKMMEFVKGARLYGLYPEDYDLKHLNDIQQIIQTDTNAKNDATLWVRNDIFLTDAFISIAKDIKRGRIPFDSTTLRKDTIISDSFYIRLLEEVMVKNDVYQVLEELEPNHAGYDSLKTYLPQWLDSADFRPRTVLSYPFKDSAAFYLQLQTRLAEDAYMLNYPRLDTGQLADAIKRYQKKHDLRVTGRPNESLVKSLNNNTDKERFKKIALNMDRFKLLPDTLPTTYIWVNLPSYYLKVWDSGAVNFESRVIVGTSKNRTPVLTSDVVNFITYPQWTVPYSIIFKEMLPQIQKNVDYLNKQNLMVVDKNDSIVDPTTIDWHKLNKNRFPYLLKQRQGDDNSLGVIKFNFRNKYSVYLHDTNVRWMFSKSQRALSHGCVRVQEWQKLADFLTRNVQEKFPADTLQAWLKRQEKHVVSGFQKVPVFIRYFTCEGTKGKVRFYEDIYGEDRLLMDRYFANKIL